jgi:hypothetical protein
VPTPYSEILDRIEAGEWDPKLTYRSGDQVGRHNFREERARLEADFKATVLRLYGVEDNPRADQAWRLAEDQGHPEGMQGTLRWFDDLVELLGTTQKQATGAERVYVVASGDEAGFVADQFRSNYEVFGNPQDAQNYVETLKATPAAAVAVDIRERPWKVFLVSVERLP